MDQLQLFLTGGFLGSGKTTAIRAAARQLHRDKKRVGVITNDQGVQQVDTRFIKGSNIPSEEVANGCFCCNYGDLEQRIANLEVNERPDVIFAESVGSCADLAATVINPLLSFNPGRYQVVLSVFADVRLLTRFLQNDRNLFFDNVNYVYEKQLEEADVIVVNKIDLLNEQQLEHAKQLIGGAYEGKVILYQNSLSPQSIEQWLAACAGFEDPSLRRSLEMDYEIYGAGEAELAWLDEEIGIVTEDRSAVAAGNRLIDKIHAKIAAYPCPIGHLKFLVDDGLEQRKVSFTSMAGGAEGAGIPEAAGAMPPETDRIIILINARVQVSPVLLERMVTDAINETEGETGCKIIENKLSVFQPGYPRPTHRITR
jgi:Ni2+-binding GTPase involved in maturation of urease and hydrogenase